MLQFFMNNKQIMLVIYSILFFLMGFAVILKINKKSELRLAQSLWLLAGYAFTHGINELIIFVHGVKEAQLSPTIEFTLQSVELAFKAGSFMFILWLGICLITDYFERYDFLKVIGTVFCTTWVVMFVYTLGIHSERPYLAVMDNLSRYMFAFPGFLLSGIGLWLQIREVEAFQIPSLVKNLKGLAITFFCAVFFTGLIANEPVFWPATVLNRRAFMEFTGVPVIFFRSWILVLITYFVIRIVDVFEIEREFRIEEALRQQVLLDERARIARDLHDGIIQSIYGVGLKLDQALILADRRLNDAKRQLVSGKEDLNKVIHSIRDYIQDLQPADFSFVSLLEGVSELVREFKEKSVMQIELKAEGQQAGEINVVQINNILQALRELLTNASKHSRATKVAIGMVFKPQEFHIRVKDNGVGFDPAGLQWHQRSGERQGLKNVFYRMGLLQGTVMFHSAPGQGTQFEITLPYRKISYAGGVFIDDPNYFKVQENN